MRYSRARIEIVYDILAIIEKAEDGEITTHILFKANLSRKILDKYLRALHLERLIEIKIVGSKTRYFMTEKGIIFLSALRHLDKMTKLFSLSSGKKREFES